MICRPFKLYRRIVNSQNTLKCDTVQILKNKKSQSANKRFLKSKEVEDRTFCQYIKNET